MLTAIGDAARRRVVALVEEELTGSLGPAPVPYAFVVLGFVAREEEAHSADQDHALVVAEEGHDEWFAAFAARVVEALEECGWPRCEGDMMVTNPAWRRTPTQWRGPVRRLVAGAGVRVGAPRRDLPRHAPLAGAPRLTEKVRRSAAATVSARLLGHLGSQALGMRPPLGFFRGFVLEQEGEHRDTLDLKRGIAAVVHLARSYALRVGSPTLATLDRFAAGATPGSTAQTDSSHAGLGTGADSGSAHAAAAHPEGRLTGRKHGGQGVRSTP